MPAVRFESPLLVFLRPELARPHRGAGVVLRGLMGGLLEDPADGVPLWAFQL